MPLVPGSTSRGLFTGGSGSPLSDVLTWSPGLGAITHVQGPGDQNLALSGNGQDIVLSAIAGQVVAFADGEALKAETETAALSTGIATARLTARSTGDIVDGFGPLLGFRVEDNAGVTENLIGEIGAERAGADNTGDLVFRPVTTGTPNERARLTSGGDFSVGVAAASISGKVHVADSSATNTALLERSAQTTDAEHAAARVLSTKTTNMVDGFGSVVQFAIQDDGAVINPIAEIGAVRAGADNTGDLVFRPITTGTANERARLTAGGDFAVGVAAASIAGKLHVADSSATNTALLERSGQTTDAEHSGARVLATKTTNMVDGFGSMVEFAIQDDGAVINPIAQIGAVRAGADNTGDIVFRPLTTGTANERARLTAAGNLGVGTVSPDHPLEVVGNISEEGANGEKLIIRTATTTHTTNSGTGTETVTGIVPAAAVVLGVVARVTTALSGTGLTTWSLGDGTDVDLYGTGLGLTVGTVADSTTWTASPRTHAFSVSASNLVLTAAAGQFDAGVVRLTVYYYECSAPTA